METALRFFTRHDAAGIGERVDAIRPAPVTEAEKRAVLATLPPTGEVVALDVRQQSRLGAARRILELLGRESVYAVKVIDVPQAAVALHARAVVLVSKRALDLLDPAEAQALVAHEIGHEYFWNDYFRARRDGDRPLLRRLELLCDGVAILTLRRSGLDAGRLTSGLEKLTRYNRARFGAALNEEGYPTMDQRREFSRRLLEWLERSRVR